MSQAVQLMFRTYNKTAQLEQVQLGIFLNLHLHFLLLENLIAPEYSAATQQAHLISAVLPLPLLICVANIELLLIPQPLQRLVIGFVLWANTQEPAHQTISQLPLMAITLQSVLPALVRLHCLQ